MGLEVGAFGAHAKFWKCPERDLMAYLPSNAAIGPNSLQPPSACEVEASNNRILRANADAALGRIGTFLTVPPLSSFDSPTLAGDAARILHQSRVARASVLAPSAPEPNQHAERVNLREWIDSAPEVVPLNDRGNYCGGGMVRSPEPPPVPRMVMPEPAPVPVNVAVPPVLRAQRESRPPVVFVTQHPPDQTWLLPAGGLQMQGGGTQYMGYSGYAPPWGDANLEDIGPMATEGGGNWLPWLLGGAALVMLGSAVGVGAKRRKRYGKR